MKKIIGIDLGTTNSVVSIMEGTTPKILENDRGGRTTPSAVWYRNDQIVVGEIAKNNEFDDNVILSAKRKIGTKDVFVLKDNTTRTPIEVSTDIISKLKQIAETKLGESVDKAVITVPAYFGSDEREATKKAAENAGLEVARLINEPTAAALAYGYSDTNANKKIMVYDLGGGTFDVTILEIFEGNFEVLATDGDKKLGGDDFDELIVNEIVLDINENHGIDLSSDKAAMKKIKQAAESIKKELSNLDETFVNIPMLTFTSNGPFNYESTFTRKRFNELSSNLVLSSIEISKRAIQESGLNENEISEIILVGGSTRVPLVKEEILKNINISINESSNPDEAVSIGAAIQGGILTGDVSELLLLDVVSLDLGIAVGFEREMSVIVSKNTTKPTSKTRNYTTLEDNQTSINIEIFEGNSKNADENNFLGSCKLDNLDPAPAGSAQIDVTFTFDNDGILHVYALDKTTGSEKNLILDKTEID